MKWFPEPYSLACQVSKKNKALLVVFIDDGSENSQQMHDICVSFDQSIFTCPVIPIQLKTQDDAFKQFTFPTPVVPAVYFIDGTSTVLKIITLVEADNAETFRVQAEEIVKTISKPSGAIVEIPANGQGDTASNNEAQLTLDDKIYQNLSKFIDRKIRLDKELQEKKHVNEDEKRKSEENEKEQERIRLGKLMQEAVQKRQEQELKESAAQRRRKMEAEAEKQRIREQIKADREEMEARLQRNVVAPHKETPTEARQPLKVESDRCRVQVRLPESNVLVEEFTSSDKLSVLVEVITKSGKVRGAFNLVQPFPRHVYTAEEMDKSFVDLYLTPSCTLTVEQSSSQLNPSNWLSYIPFLFSYLVISPLSYIFGINTAVKTTQGDTAALPEGSIISTLFYVIEIVIVICMLHIFCILFADLAEEKIYFK